jgi:hypothetical protein
MQTPDENGFMPPEEYAPGEDIPTPIIPSRTAPSALFHDRENLLLGAALGAIGAALGAIGWATLAAVSTNRVGYAAIFVGVLTGFAVRFGGKGTRKVFGLVAALLAALGCALGMVLALFVEQALEGSQGGQGSFMALLWQALTSTPILEALIKGFDPVNAFFSVIGIQQAYSLAWTRTLPESDLSELPT